MYFPKKRFVLNAFCFFCLFFFSLSTSCIAEESTEDASRDLFKESMCARIDLALNDTFSDTAEATSEFLQDLFWRLRFSKEVEMLAFDHEIRPYFHSMHEILERVISQALGKELTNLSVFIHTNNPSGDPCGDIHRSFTPEQNLNTFLFKGAELYVIHPSPSVFREAADVKMISIKGKIPTSYYSIDIVSPKIPLYIEGVTYAFSDLNGERYLCGMRTKTKNSEYDITSFDLFFGKEEELISRLREIQNLIDQTQDPLPVTEEEQT